MDQNIKIRTDNVESVEYGGPVDKILVFIILEIE